MIKLLKSIDGKGMWVPVLLGLLITCGSYGATYAYVPFNRPYFYVVLCINVIVAVVVFIGIDRALMLHASKMSARARVKADHGKNGLARLSVLKDPTSVLPNALRILLCWLPYLILLYPGVMCWDTGDQLAQFFGISAFGMPAGQIWDHHPWFSTYLFGAITQVGYLITGSYLFGLFLNALLQYVVVTLLFSWTLSILYSKGLSEKALGGISLFMRFFPPLPIICSAMSKDVTNAIALYCWILLYLKLATNELDKHNKAGFVCLFVVVTLIVSLSKKMGMYIVLAALLALLFFRFSLKIKTLIIAGCFVLFSLLNLVLPTYLYPALNIVKGGSQAAIVMPIELLGRVAHCYPEDITEEEEETINSYLAYSWDEMSANYNPYISDPVTGYTLKGEVPLTAFLKVWLQIGLRHPLTYLNAFFSLESGWISFAGSPTLAAQSEPYRQDPLLFEPVFYAKYNADTFGKLEKQQDESWAQKIVENVYDWFSRLPVLNSLCYVAMWTSAVPAFVLFELIRRPHKDLLFVSIPYLISVVTLFVYPVSLSAQTQDPTRYMFHTLLLAPLLAGLVFLNPWRESKIHVSGKTENIVSQDI